MCLGFSLLRPNQLHFKFQYSIYLELYQIYTTTIILFIDMSCPSRRTNRRNDGYYNMTPGFCSTFLIVWIHIFYQHYIILLFLNLIKICPFTCSCLLMWNIKALALTVQKLLARLKFQRGGQNDRMTDRTKTIYLRSWRRPCT